MQGVEELEQVGLGQEEQVPLVVRVQVVLVLEELVLQEGLEVELLQEGLGQVAQELLLEEQVAVGQEVVVLAAQLVEPQLEVAEQQVALEALPNQPPAAD